jgi:hypothetical protein
MAPRSGAAGASARRSGGRKPCPRCGSTCSRRLGRGKRTGPSRPPNDADPGPSQLFPAKKPFLGDRGRGAIHGPSRAGTARRLGTIPMPPSWQYSFPPLTVASVYVRMAAVATAVAAVASTLSSSPPFRASSPRRARGEPNDHGPNVCSIRSRTPSRSIPSAASADQPPPPQRSAAVRLAGPATPRRP